MAQKSIFDYFGLKTAFVVDEEALEAGYVTMIKKMHPDLFASRPAAERRVAEQWSARLNEAYATIKDPVRRATYLCEAAGYDVGAEKNTAMPMDFLMTQMRWREMLDGHADDEAVMEKLRAECDAEAASLLEGLAKAIDTDRQYDRAVELTRKLMFVEKFQHQLKKKEQH